MEKSFVLIKPDGVQRGLLGEVINRLERKGLKLVGIKMMQLDDTILNVHYSHLADKPFFGEIRDFMKSAPVVATCWEGLDCVATIRRICGITNAREADPGTIRGDFAMSIQANIVHASDSVETGLAEVERFFKPEELFTYAPATLDFVYSKGEQDTIAKNV